MSAAKVTPFDARVESAARRLSARQSTVAKVAPFAPRIESAKGDFRR
jgi:hypothetical protein